MTEILFFIFASFEPLSGILYVGVNHCFEKVIAALTLCSLVCDHSFNQNNLVTMYPEPYSTKISKRSIPTWKSELNSIDFRRQYNFT